MNIGKKTILQKRIFIFFYIVLQKTILKLKKHKFKLNTEKLFVILEDIQRFLCGGTVLYKCILKTVFKTCSPNFWLAYDEKIVSTHG